MRETEKQIKRVSNIKEVLNATVKEISEAFIQELQTSERVREDKYDSYVERWYLGVVPALESDLDRFYLDKFGDLRMAEDARENNLQIVYQYIIAVEYGNHLPAKYSIELTAAYNKIQTNEDLRIKNL
ncbi:hypothetical protein HCA69_15955 [Listeria grandensis]|uniref:Uncharacterized protein n=1 Tax=Listeria grandensis TaxID=1494963 RepID=A0A7X0Y6P9_9LIST|nr:hypothetical protein [Listeria grandensis]MBC1937858.1 hypothetical protein [Listeria grandensis]